jgi:hypothetical protein
LGAQSARHLKTPGGTGWACENKPRATELEGSCNHIEIYARTAVRRDSQGERLGRSSPKLQVSELAIHRGWSAFRHLAALRTYERGRRSVWAWKRATQWECGWGRLKADRKQWMDVCGDSGAYTSGAAPLHYNRLRVRLRSLPGCELPRSSGPYPLPAQHPLLRPGPYILNFLTLLSLLPKWIISLLLYQCLLLHSLLVRPHIALSHTLSVSLHSLGLIS